MRTRGTSGTPDPRFQAVSADRGASKAHTGFEHLQIGPFVKPAFPEGGPMPVITFDELNDVRLAAA
jgi:hypothetical protein